MHSLFNTNFPSLTLVSATEKDPNWMCFFVLFLWEKSILTYPNVSYWHLYAAIPTPPNPMWLSYQATGMGQEADNVMVWWGRMSWVSDLFMHLRHGMQIRKRKSFNHVLSEFKVLKHWWLAWTGKRKKGRYLEWNLLLKSTAACRGSIWMTSDIRCTGKARLPYL